MDTEVYSNTGGQASKSTPVGAVAKFALQEKDPEKRPGHDGYELWLCLCCTGCNGSKSGTILKAPGSRSYRASLIIAYSPCINHGMKAGMGEHRPGKSAVQAGYWSLFRHNPMLEEEGKNPFQLDSKEPEWTYSRNS